MPLQVISNYYVHLTSVKQRYEHVVLTVLNSFFLEK